MRLIADALTINDAMRLAAVFGKRMRGVVEVKTKGVETGNAYARYQPPVE